MSSGFFLEMSGVQQTGEVVALRFDIDNPICIIRSWAIQQTPSVYHNHVNPIVKTFSKAPVFSTERWTNEKRIPSTGSSITY